MPTATTIDALVVTLGLDATQFTAAQKAALDAFKRTQDQAVSGGKEIEAQGKKLDEYFSVLKRGALEIVGVFLAGRGVKEFIGHITNLDASVGRVAKTMNMSVVELSAWQGAAEMTGGSAEGITTALQGLSDAMNTFELTGQGAFLGVFQHLNLNIHNVDGTLKSVGQMFREIAGAAKDLNPTDLARLRATLLLIPGMNTESINMMVDGRTKLEALLDTAAKAGGVTAKSADDAAKFNTELKILERTALSASRVLLGNFLPAITGALKQFGDAIKAGPTGGKPFWEWFLAPPSVSVTPGSLFDRLRSFFLPAFYPPSPADRTSWSGGSDYDVAKKRLGAVLGSTSFGGTRGDRNNNPGNIEYGPFAIKHGATGTDGRFAIFPSKETGEAAMDALLASGYRGLTLEQIQRKWVGNSDSGYLGSMMKATGLNADSVPDLSNPAVRRSLMRGMSRGEGTNLSATPFGAGGAAQISNSRGGDISSSSSNVSIGNINVQTQATDAEGIARDIGPAMRRSGFAAGANYGQL